MHPISGGPVSSVRSVFSGDNLTRMKRSLHQQFRRKRRIENATSRQQRSLRHQAMLLPRLSGSRHRVRCEAVSWEDMKSPKRRTRNKSLHEAHEGRENFRSACAKPHLFFEDFWPASPRQNRPTLPVEYASPPRELDTPPSFRPALRPMPPFKRHRRRKKPCNLSPTEC